MPLNVKVESPTRSLILSDPDFDSRKHEHLKGEIQVKAKVRPFTMSLFDPLNLWMNPFCKPDLISIIVYQECPGIQIKIKAQLSALSPFDLFFKSFFIFIVVRNIKKIVRHKTSR